jgi:integrase
MNRMYSGSKIVSENYYFISKRKTLDDWPSQDVARMLKLAMVTGMRRGEIFKLEDQDADFRNLLARYVIQIAGNRQQWF